MTNKYDKKLQKIIVKKKMRTQYYARVRKFRKSGRYFVFFDVETKEEQITEKVKQLLFFMCTAIFWDRKTNKIVKKIYYHPFDFWYDVVNFFKNSDEEKQNVYLFAHNTAFDVDQMELWKYMRFFEFKPGFRTSKSPPYIATFEKNDFVLNIWDTMNYIPESLENIGKYVGLQKLEIDFNKCSDKELENYCMTDTEIVFEFIRQFVETLEKLGLTELKPTIASCAFNSFFINFYYPNKFEVNTNIGIHTDTQTIKLERRSYKGGISDCFKIGEYYYEIKKLDINSMYPYIMRNMPLPIRWIGWLAEFDSSQIQLFNFYNKHKRNYLFILTCTVSLPKEASYVINNFKDVSVLNKNVFWHGTTKITLCTPELEFIEKYGKILKIHTLSVYQPGRLFRDYVDFFYALRMKAKKEKNVFLEKICKLFLNTFYGKWGQKQIISKDFTLKSNRKIYKKYTKATWYHLLDYCQKHSLKLRDLKDKIIYLASINGIEFWCIFGKIQYSIKTEQNAKSSFVAICSFITSYARMMLIKYILIVGRKELFYSDTDSLVVSLKGYHKLLKANLISETKLGLLKIEQELTDREMSGFYGPKFYRLAAILKCKGKRRNAVIVEENEETLIVEQEYWERDKTKMRKGTTSMQIIEIKKKHISKKYTKGKIDKLGNVIPYSISEIMALT